MTSPFGAKRIVGLFLLAVLVAAFVTYMALNVPIRSPRLAGPQAFKHLSAVLAAIAIVVIVDLITLVAMVRRLRRRRSG